MLRNIRWLLWLMTAVFLSNGTLNAQTLTQTIYGKVENALTSEPLPGANVMIRYSDPAIGTTTDTEGKYELNNVPVGRYTLLISFVGFESKTLEAVELISAKRLKLNIALYPVAKQLGAVEIKSTEIFYAEAPMLNIEEINSEKIMRFAATQNDPARVSTSFAGVATVNDQANHVSVHGLSPNANAWYLEGVPIANPNHLSNAGTTSDRPASTGGGVNVIPAQVLSSSGFYKNFFPAQFGNALGGIYDMRFRKGNTEQNTYNAQAGLIGLELSADGPLSESKDHAFLAHYRYSTVGLLGALGVDFGNESINYQDLSFNLVFESTGNTELKIFGTAGNSSNKLDFLDEGEDIETEKDLQKVDYTSQLGALGFSYRQLFNSFQYSLTILGSGFSQERTGTIKINPDSILRKDKDQWDQAQLATKLEFVHNLKNRTRIHYGIVSTFRDFSLDYGSSTPQGISLPKKIFGSDQDITYQPFAQVDLNFYQTKLIAGAKALYNDLSDAFVVDPVLQLVYTPNKKSTIGLSAQGNSQLQLLTVLYAIPDFNTLSIPNFGLTPTRSWDLALNFLQQLNSSWIFKSQFYYQYLYDVPQAVNSGTVFSVLNNYEEFVSDSLNNSGSGNNYGVDLSIEKTFAEQYYLLANTSLFRSTFEDINGKTYSTAFDAKYLINLSAGYEKARTSNPNSFINFNLRVLLRGGYPYTPIDTAASVIANETVYFRDQTNDKVLPAYFRSDAGIRFKKNKEKVTRTWLIDIQNIANTQNIAYKYFDIAKREVKNKYHLGIVPILTYRLDF